jgi:hypothetical protein
MLWLSIQGIRFILELSQTPTKRNNSGRAQPAILTFICIGAHLFVLFILANLNFRNVPHLFSFLSGAAEAMNRNEAVSEGLDSVRRSVTSPCGLFDAWEKDAL